MSCEFMIYPDSVFHPAYCEASVLLNEGTAQQFVHEDELGKVSYCFIKRKIDNIYDQELFDIITPYGYGGPVVIESKGDRKKLCQNFFEKFREYCSRNNIISEFVRFHPIIKNQDDFFEFYDMKVNRNVVAMDLTVNDIILDELGPKTRKLYRRTLKNGMSAQWDFDCERIDDFIELYKNTMDRNQASEFYYFEKDYFNKLINELPEKPILLFISLEGKNIAAIFALRGKKMLNVHLSACDISKSDNNANYTTRIELALWGKTQGYEKLLFGGGRAASEDDSLYLFKRKFTNSPPIPFYTGKKIYNQDIYDKLCKDAKLKEQDYESDFFPLYRAKG